MITFKEAVTREEFVATLPVLKQDLGDVSDNELLVRNFAIAREHNYRHFVALKNDTIIAVLGVTKTYSPNYNTPTCDIISFVVDEKHRGQGIGSQCLDFCKAFACEDGSDCLRLVAYPTNYPVLAFYQKNGFKHTGNFMFQSLDDGNQ